MPVLSAPYRKLYERLAGQLFVIGDGEAPVLLQWEPAHAGDPPLSREHPDLRDLRHPFDNGHECYGDTWPLRVAQQTYRAWRESQADVPSEQQEPPWHLPVLAAMVGILGQERSFFRVYPPLCAALGCDFGGPEIERLEQPSWKKLWSSFEEWSIGAQSRGRFRVLQAGRSEHIYVRLLRGQMVVTSLEIRQIVQSLRRDGFDAVDLPSTTEVMLVARRVLDPSPQLQMTLEDEHRRDLLRDLVARHLVAGDGTLAENGNGGQGEGAIPRLRRVLFRDRGRIVECCWRAEMRQSGNTRFRMDGIGYRIGDSSWDLEQDLGSGEWTSVCGFKSTVEHPRIFPLFRNAAAGAAFYGRFSYPPRIVRVFVEQDGCWIEVPKPFSESKRAILMFAPAGMPPVAVDAAVPRIPLSSQLRVALGSDFCASIEFLDVDLDQLPDELRDHPLLSNKLARAAAQDAPSDFIDCDSGVLVSRSPRTYLSYFLPRRCARADGGRGELLVIQKSEGVVPVVLPNGRELSLAFTTPEVPVWSGDVQQPESSFEVEAVGDPIDGAFLGLHEVLLPALPTLTLLQAIPSRSPASQEYWRDKAVEFLERLNAAAGAGGDISERAKWVLRNASARGHIDISEVEGRGAKYVSACPPELILTAIPAKEPGRRIGWLRGGWDWWKLARNAVSPAAAALGWMVNPEAIDDVAQVLVCGSREQLRAFAEESGVHFRSRIPLSFKISEAPPENSLVDDRDIAELACEFFNPYRPDKPSRIRPEFRDEDQRSIHKLFGKGQIFLYRDLLADGVPVRRWRAGRTNHAAGWKGGPELTTDAAMACRLDIFKAAWSRIAEIGLHGTPGAPYSSPHGNLSFPSELRLPPSVGRVLYACSGGGLAFSGQNSSQLARALLECKLPSGPVCPHGKLRTFAHIPRDVAAHVVNQLGWALAEQENSDGL